MAGMALGQIAVGPISDDKGRRLPLMVGMAVFTLSTVAVFGRRPFRSSSSSGSSRLCRWCRYRPVPGHCPRHLQGQRLDAALCHAHAGQWDCTDSGSRHRRPDPALCPVGSVFLFIAIVGLILTVSAGLMRETLPQRRRVSGGMAASMKSFTALFRQPYFMGHCIMQCFSFAAFFCLYFRLILCFPERLRRISSGFQPHLWHQWCRPHDQRCRYGPVDRPHC